MSTRELNNVSKRELERERDYNSKHSKTNQNVKKKKFRFFNMGGFDIGYLMLVFLLLTIGLVMLASASYVTAKYGGKANNDAFFYIKRQAAFAICGIALMFVVSRLDTNFIKKITPLVSVICFLLLVAVLFMHSKDSGNDEEDTVKRWLDLGFFRFQPSDVAKLGIIMLFAWMFDKFKKQLDDKWWVAIVFWAILGMFCALILLEKHLSCTILVFSIGFFMYYLGGIDRRWIWLILIVGVIAVFVVVKFRYEILNTYQADRITSYIHKDYSDTDKRWQTNQSLFALGSGGVFGLGLGNSRQKYLYMSEPHNDFIFAIVGEELGFLRSIIIIAIFAALVCYGFIIALRARSMFDRLLVLGISLQLGLQVILNIGVVTDILPNTGISLPFFSYGGTALVMQLIEVGMVLSVSRSANKGK